MAFVRPAREAGLTPLYVPSDMSQLVGLLRGGFFDIKINHVAQTQENKYG